MTVKQLVEKLQKLSPDALVFYPFNGKDEEVTVVTHNSERVILY